MKDLKYKLGDTILFEDPTAGDYKRKRGIISAITSISTCDTVKLKRTKYICCILNEKNQLIGFQNGDCIIDIDIILSNSNIVLSEKNMYKQYSSGSRSNFDKISTTLTSMLERFHVEKIYLRNLIVEKI